jgi:hypothetical protein
MSAERYLIGDATLDLSQGSLRRHIRFKEGLRKAGMPER